MTDRKPRIAVDMDDVIADTQERFAELYRKHHNIELNPDILYGKEIREVLPPDIRDTVHQYVNEPGFFRHIPVMPDSQKILHELTGRYDVYIVSAAMEFKNSLIDKYEWLAEHFSFIPWTHIIFCGHKIVNVDVIIDDRIRNFVGFDGRKLLYSSPHNMLVEGFERVGSWQEVADKLL